MHNREDFPDWVGYLIWVVLIFISLLVGGWMRGYLTPVISLWFVQEAAVNAISALAGYVVLVWGYILVTAVFRKKIDHSEAGGRSEMSTPNLISSLIAVGALVGIPLSIILWILIDSI